jgi:hypothetical protein
LPALTSLPPAVTGADANTLYQAIVKQVAASPAANTPGAAPATLVADFFARCKKYGSVEQSMAEANRAEAADFVGWLRSKFGDAFAASVLPQVSRLVPQDSKRWALLQAAGMLGAPPGAPPGGGLQSEQSEGSPARTSAPASASAGAKEEDIGSGDWLAGAGSSRRRGSSMFAAASDDDEEEAVPAVRSGLFAAPAPAPAAAEDEDDVEDLKNLLFSAPPAAAAAATTAVVSGGLFSGGGGLFAPAPPVPGHGLTVAEQAVRQEEERRERDAARSVVHAAEAAAEAAQEQAEQQHQDWAVLLALAADEKTQVWMCCRRCVHSSNTCLPGCRLQPLSRRSMPSDQRPLLHSTTVHNPAVNTPRRSSHFRHPA